jgi:hypothetical protein
MTPRTERRLLGGPAGNIEVVIDRPGAGDAALRGIGFVGHPHPLYGGTLDNKVAATLARSFAAAGFVAVRPNFRGVGATEGAHDDGRGETDDFLHLIEGRRAWLDASPDLPLVLSGFSFGSFVAAQAARALHRRSVPLAGLVLVGSAAGKWPMPDVVAFAPQALLIHGELDDTIPLAAVFDWARPQELPVVVLPGADHFFHRRLSSLKQLVTRHLLSTAIDVPGQSR